MKAKRSTYRSHKQIECLCLAIVVLMLAGCGSGRAPERVVERMFTALEEGDHDAYLDTLLPANRVRPDLDGVIAVLLGGVGIGAGPVSVDVGGLLAPSFADMEYRTVAGDRGHVVVQARGNMRVLMMEYPFCESFDVVRSSGNWYIDKFHQDRQARIERLIVRNEARLTQQGMQFPESGDPLTDLGNLFNAFGAGATVALDMCE